MAATVSRGALNQYSTGVSGGTTPAALYIAADVDDFTKKQKRTDTPFSSKIGRSSPQSRQNITRPWGWGSPDPISDTITEAIADTSGTTLTVASGYYTVGDIIQIDSEQMRVTAVNSATSITVTRGFAGTTAATHLDNAVVILLAPALAENADDPDGIITQGETDYNYYQIMSFTWQLSQRGKVTPTYETKGASGDNFAFQLKKKMQETAPLRLEMQCLLGQRAIGTSASPSAMGGLTQSSYITTRTSLSSAILTEYDVMNGLQTVHNLVGPSTAPKVAMMSPFFKRVFGSWGNTVREVENSDTSLNYRIDKIMTDFGEIELVSNYLMTTVASDKVYFFNWNDFTLEPYHSSTGWQTGKLATQGWYDKGFLRADMTLVAQNPDTRLELSSISTTAGSYSGLA